MHATSSNMNTYDYNHAQNKMHVTKSKANKIEEITLSNTTDFESNTWKLYFFDKTAIIQIQYCLLDKNNIYSRGLLVFFQQPENCW